MKCIPDKSIDMILCDLPYGTTASNWDKIIDAEKMWEQYERIINDRGAIVLFSSGSFTNKLINSNPNLYRYKWIWIKTRKGNFVNAKNRPLTNFEEICIFSKGITANTKHEDRKMKYYPQGLIEVEPKLKSSSRKFGNMHGVRKSHKEKYVRVHENYPTDVLYYNSVGKGLHPSQKPLDLIEYLIKTYTLENEVVLDNCMGSGTTAVAAMNTNRQYIGFELDDENYEIATNRIVEHKGIGVKCDGNE